MSAYQVENQWGGSSAPWHQGSTWILGGRANQAIVGVDIKSTDNGKTFQGSITYAGEGPIDFKATQVSGNVYDCEVQWGGSSAPWHADGRWTIGGRARQSCIALKATSADNGATFGGEMTYLGEGPIGFKATRVSSYTVENQWGGSTAPWHPGGVWVLSGRCGQDVLKMGIASSDNGTTLTGSMTYAGEGPIGFLGKNATGDVYEVSNQWGGSSAPWHRGGDMIVGGRIGQPVVALSFESTDGKSLSGTMTYLGEGPIGFRATRNPV